MSATPPSVRKASGDVEPYEERKLLTSLRRAGAREDVAREVADEVRLKLHEGMTTKELYRIAFRILRRKQRHTAARYSLKKSVMALGPSGHPFERFFAAILEAQDYQTEVGVTLRGKCVEHEVDVVAWRAGHRLLAECKFHSDARVRSDVKVALYVQSRRLDLAASPHVEPFDEFLLVTNTRFTTDAIEFGTCAGLGMLSWDHPRDEGLGHTIERLRLHPVTCLASLAGTKKRELIHRGVVLVRDLVAQPQVLEEIQVPRRTARRTLDEADALLNALPGV
ncbi:MAG: ATP cone domain-containing protein [Planctomycetota bacterium]